MAFIHFETAKCPQCGLPFDISFFGLSSGLGPSKNKCIRCKAVFDIHRSEWSKMDRRNRLLFLAISAGYVFIGSILAAQVLWSIDQIYHGVDKIEAFKFDSPQFKLYWKIMMAFVVLFQAIRILQSYQRTTQSNFPEQKQDEVDSLSFFTMNMNVGLHLKFLVLFTAAYFASYLFRP